jgi:hypothetical protein
MQKDNVDLICSIAELASCFERSHSIKEFLSEAIATSPNTCRRESGLSISTTKSLPTWF